jgi:hypothetical protein
MSEWASTAQTVHPAMSAGVVGALGGESAFAADGSGVATSIPGNVAWREAEDMLNKSASQPG